MGGPAAPSTPPMGATGPVSSSPSRQPMLLAGISGIVLGLAAVFGLASSGRLPVSISPGVTATGTTIAAIQPTATVSQPVVASPSASPTPTRVAATPTIAPTFTPAPSSTPAPSITPTPVVTPPALGNVVISDPLTSARVFDSGVCPLRLDRAAFVDGGYQITIGGKCSESSEVAFVNATSRRLTFMDGEYRVQARVVAGAPRAMFSLAARVGEGRSHGYLVRFDPITPQVRLSRWDAASEVSSDAMVDVTDRSRLPFVDGRNTVAMRFQGPRIWVLLNDTVVASAEDSTYDRGAVEVGAGRLGDITDQYETATLFRSLEIRVLANGDPSRVPVLQP